MTQDVTLACNLLCGKVFGSTQNGTVHQITSNRCLCLFADLTSLNIPARRISPNKATLSAATQVHHDYMIVLFQPPKQHIHTHCSNSFIVHVCVKKQICRISLSAH